MASAFVALGGNLGDVERTFRSALGELDRAATHVRRISSVLRSSPVGADAGDPFHNAAAELDTRLEPLDLLDLLQDVERRHGRTRGVHWGPRTLDLDLLLYDDRRIDLPRLQVPHPAAWYRRFVLDPLAEIAPDVVHPVKQLPVVVLRERLLARPLSAALAGGTATARRQFADELRPRFPQTVLGEWEPLAAEPALLAWLGPDPASPTLTFDRLPLAPRLDVLGSGQPARDFLTHVLQSALGDYSVSGFRRPDFQSGRLGAG